MNLDIIKKHGIITRYSQRMARGRVQIRGKRYTFYLTGWRGSPIKAHPKTGQRVDCLFNRGIDQLVAVWAKEHAS